MKTISTPTYCGSLASPRISGFIRLLAFACIGLFTAVLAAPIAQAAGPDGVYKLTKITGSFKANGQNVNIPANLLQNALVQQGAFTIKNNQVPIYGNKWSNVFNQFNSFGFKGKVKVTGPEKFVLKKSGANYVGQSDKPVSLSLNGTFNGQRISLAMKINFSAKINGDNLTMTVPIKISAMGLVNVNGTVVMKAKKK